LKLEAKMEFRRVNVFKGNSHRLGSVSKCRSPLQSLW
jgi:hypothetical protein